MNTDSRQGKCIEASGRERLEKIVMVGNFLVESRYSRNSASLGLNGGNYFNFCLYGNEKQKQTLFWKQGFVVGTF